MKAIQAIDHGDARTVLRPVEIDPPDAPGPGQVRVEIEYSPLNQHDLLVIAGVLPSPPLPFVPGNEGMGIVRELGDGVDNVAVGDRVVLPLLTGAWREQLVLAADGLAALPDGDPEQLAMLGSNPPSAVLLLDLFIEIPENGYVVQNAANSGVGRSLIAIAHARGLKTINLARNAASFDELRAAGADIVVPDAPESVAIVKEQIGDAPVPLAIDAVGGPSTTTLAQIVTAPSRLVTYAQGSGLPLEVPGLALEGKHLSVHGFFVGEHDFATVVASAIAEAAPLVADGRLTVPIAGVFAFHEIKAALDQLDRGGKVLLKR